MECTGTVIEQRMIKWIDKCTFFFIICFSWDKNVHVLGAPLTLFVTGLWWNPSEFGFDIHNNLASGRWRVRTVHRVVTGTGIDIGESWQEVQIP